MKVFIQSIVAQLLLTPYIYWRGYQALPARRTWRIPYTLAFALELLLYFFGFFFREDLPDGIFIPIMNICNTWYIGSIYLTLGLLCLELIRLTQKHWEWLPACIAQNWDRLKLPLLFFFLIADALLLVKAHQNVVDPVVKHLYIDLPKGSSTRDSLTIVMVSDIHLGEVIQKPQAEKLVELSNAQHPDLVVMVGDLLDYESRFAENAHIEEDFQRLEAPLGVYSTYGNHEYRANRFAKERWIRKFSTLLKDSVASPDGTFYLIGRDDMVNKKREPLQKLITGLDTTKPLIVLDHQPWSFAEMRMNHVDLGLHGHTHNGQLWPYPLLMKLIYECPFGYYRKGGVQHYVSCGYGCAGPAYRVGTRSELIVLHIRFKAAS